MWGLGRRFGFMTHAASRHVLVCISFSLDLVGLPFLHMCEGMSKDHGLESSGEHMYQTSCICQSVTHSRFFAHHAVRRERPVWHEREGHAACLG